MFACAALSKCVFHVNIWRVCLRALVCQPRCLWPAMRHEHAHLSCRVGRQCSCLLTWVRVKLCWSSVSGQTVYTWQDMSLACSLGSRGLIEGFCGRTLMWCLSWVRKTPVARSKTQGRFFPYFWRFKLTAGPAKMCDHILLWSLMLWQWQWHWQWQCSDHQKTCLPAYTCMLLKIWVVSRD